MADKRYVGTFQTEDQVLDKIEQLIVEGYSEDDIYVVTNDADSLSIVRGQTDVDLKSSEGGWLDRFLAFLSGDEPVRAAFTDMGFTEEESSRYYDEVKNGNILLYVDKDYSPTFTDGQAGYMGGVTDPHIGSNQMAVNDLDEPLINPTGLDVDTGEEERLHLHEEKLNVDKDRVQTGEVNVGKHVVEEEQTVEIPVTREEVEIERRAVHDETAAGKVFDDGENIHIPVTEERVEVTKRPVVSEEIVVSKREVQDTETVQETVRREEADIDRTDKSELDEKLNSDRNSPAYDSLRDQDKL